MNPVFEKVSFELSKQELETLQNLIGEEIGGIYCGERWSIQSSTPNRYRLEGNLIMNTSAGKVIIKNCHTILGTPTNGTCGVFRSIEFATDEKYQDGASISNHLVKFNDFITERVEVYSQATFIDEPEFLVSFDQYESEPNHAEPLYGHLQIFTVSEKFIVFHSTDGRSFFIAPTGNPKNPKTLITNGSDAVKKELARLKNSGNVTLRYLLY